MGGFPFFGTSRILRAVRSSLDSFIGLLQTRLEIAAIELQEEHQRLLGIVAGAALAVFLGVLFAFSFTVAMIITFWETPYRLWVVWGFVAVYGVLAGVFVACLRHQVQNMPKPFENTISELRKDRAWLRPE